MLCPAIIVDSPKIIVDIPIAIINNPISLITFCIFHYSLKVLNRQVMVFL